MGRERENRNEREIPRESFMDETLGELTALSRYLISIDLALPRCSFLVACTRLYTLFCWSVRPSVHRSVCPSAFMRFLALLLLSRYSTDLEYCPCLLVRDWGSRVTSLIPSVLSLSGFFRLKKKMACKCAGSSRSWPDFVYRSRGLKRDLGMCGNRYC